MPLSQSQKLFIILNAFFLTFLILAEVTGSKLFVSFGFTLTMGVIPFPVTFIVTDLLNEYYGRKGVRFTTLLGMVMIFLAYFLLMLDMLIPAAPNSPVDNHSFNVVFSNSGKVIVGSIVAYLIGQLIDIQIFHFLRIKTENKYIWLRATGSTIVSQLVDSFVVIYIALSGGKLSFQELNQISTNNFIYKCGVAIAITPLIYGAHHCINWYLGKEAEEMIEFAMKEGRSDIKPD
ncbi:queuosine precursor transporter [Leptospira borgpetersenii]|uniref:queuosine precursor transporter n=1 Tax=Leptospira borgpetersenii TaxID=174 RepID=UPI001881396B|nr:queuosine precursor transporter [Leptospira borgpetersenii]MBE8365341.1 queuosine precursor transporter [Leptospira borgpetersenii serovar Balcanica]MBE8367538.1 queuosine precursor transporter [Leptospira borgpetersenii serovar Balcanica]MBE8424457.1 queuosine precursor transporter [Leptospira borgpetersenii serovar Balcanica]MBF3351550.1 queuosine precursor transporter [Leptospira borgpetersenii serovar Balcanica]